MKTEVSAGGIIVYSSALGWEVLLIRDMNHNWTFPKGIVEPQEDTVTAAEREVKEEVGLTNLTRLVTLTPVTYFFSRNEEKIKKIVHYFLFSVSTKEQLIPQESEGISQARWFLLNDLDGILGYPETNKQLITEAREQL
jgi:ADP-ribose pyrophosphatase YjhB (NUDIX family)